MDESQKMDRKRYIWRETKVDTTSFDNRRHIHSRVGGLDASACYKHSSDEVCIVQKRDQHTESVTEGRLKTNAPFHNIFEQHRVRAV